MTQDAHTGAVLVIEDDPSLAALYSEFLSSKYTVYQALDGSEGLDMMDDCVDVVLLDRRMPGLSGVEVLDTIRSHFDRCQVAMVTAVNPDFDVLEMEFDEYITKPVSKDELVGLVDQLLYRASYDDDIRRFLSLASKRSALEGNKSPEELEDHDEYETLVQEMGALNERLENELTELDAAGFESLFRALDRG